MFLSFTFFSQEAPNPLDIVYVVITTNLDIDYWIL